MELMTRHAFFAAAKHVHSLKPKVQRYMRGLEHGSNRHSELSLAWPAAPQADTPAVYLRNPVKTTATRAARTMRPQDAFKLPIGSRFAMEPRGGQNGSGYERSP